MFNAWKNILSLRCGPLDDEIRVAPAGVRLTLLRPSFKEVSIKTADITLDHILCF